MYNAPLGVWIEWTVGVLRREALAEFNFNLRWLQIAGYRYQDGQLIQLPGCHYCGEVFTTGGWHCPSCGAC